MALRLNFAIECPKVCWPGDNFWAKMHQCCERGHNRREGVGNAGNHSFAGSDGSGVAERVGLAVAWTAATAVQLTATALIMGGTGHPLSSPARSADIHQPVHGQRGRRFHQPGGGRRPPRRQIRSAGWAATEAATPSSPRAVLPGGGLADIRYVRGRRAGEPERVRSRRRAAPTTQMCRLTRPGHPTRVLHRPGTSSSSSATRRAR